MKTQHVLAAAAMVLLVAPIVLGLGAFFLIPLILLAIATLPSAIIGGGVMLVIASHRAQGRSHDDFFPQPPVYIPVHAAR